jgi:uncharacterized lipoprotein YajG
MFRALVMTLTLGLCACSNTVSSLQYAPTAAVQSTASPSIGIVAATDQRKEQPRQLATVMGGFGNPLKTLETAKAVKDEIADAFAQGLRARGLMAASEQAPFRVALVVRKFDADMLLGRTARIDLTLSVINQAGATVYEDTAVDSESEGYKPFQVGMMADINDLKRLCEIVLARTVDHMLDNPAFRAVVARGA